MTLELDHIVVGAATLDQGRAWARDRLGVEPSTGGRHALMGTHNLLIRLDDPAGRERYLEIIALDPDAPDPGRPRWFDLDSPAVLDALVLEPRLLAWVARSDAIEADRERLIAYGSDPGPVVSASRELPDGWLRWRITVPPDGARVAGGAVPLLIAWDGRRPAASLPPSGVSLERLKVRGLDSDVATTLAAAGADMDEGSGPALSASFATPTGRLELDSI